MPLLPSSPCSGLRPALGGLLLPGGRVPQAAAVAGPSRNCRRGRAAGGRAVPGAGAGFALPVTGAVVASSMTEAAFCRDASAFGMTGSAFRMAAAAFGCAASASCSAAVAFWGSVMVTEREKADTWEEKAATFLRKDAADIKKAVAGCQKGDTIRKQVTSNLFSDDAKLG